MKRKRLLSTAVAGMLVAAQMVMPVTAATYEGTVTATVTTRSAVVRVQVPTTLEVAVDEFQLAGDGSQINSGEFFIKNYSTMAVKVTAKSIVTPGTNTSLVATKDAVVKNTSTPANGTAWLAVIAKTAADSYGMEAGKTAADVTGEEDNVAVFPTAGASTPAPITQEFYLAQGTGDVKYTGIKIPAATPAPSAFPVSSYAQVYKLTPETVNDNDALVNALKAKTLYAIKTADLSEATKASSLEVTKIAPDATQKDSALTYYTMNATPTSAPAANEVYAYAEQATVGGEAGFRYIGKLSEGKTNGWTKNDFTTIKIDYTITGVPADDFAEADKDCKYGLYTAPVAPAVTGYSSAPLEKTVAKDTAISIPVSLGKGSKALKSIKVALADGTDLVSNGTVVLDTENVAIAITKETINGLIDADNNAPSSAKLLPMTLKVYFNGNTEPDAEIKLKK